MIGIACFLPKSVISWLRFETSTSTRGPSLIAFEGGAVVAHRDVVVVAAVHELEEPVRQPPPRGFAEVVGVVEAERVVLHFNAGS